MAPHKFGSTITSLFIAEYILIGVGNKIKESIVDLKKPIDNNFAEAVFKNELNQLLKEMENSFYFDWKKGKYEEYFTKKTSRTEKECLSSKILAHYYEKHRSYHNINHIIFCLRELEKTPNEDSEYLMLEGIPEIVNHRMVKMGIIFHDMVYNTKEIDNEEKSAEKAEEYLKEMGVLPGFISNLKENILATKHNLPPQSLEAKVLVDIDLSILGQSRKVFDEYQKNIRKEYSWIPEEEYNFARALFLEKFLNKKIYNLGYFRNKYEEKAKRNLERALKELKSK